MKKKFEGLKTFQLILSVVITIAALAVLFTDQALYQMVGRDPSVRILCILLWLSLLLSFIFIFIDLKTNSSFKKDYRELDYAVYNDHVAGIANRFSCDTMIEKYFNKPLPPTVGCVMLEISNIQSINLTYGRVQGNAAILGFSDILNASSVGLCFVGRNGGNKFMALFEDCNENKINVFLTRVSQKTELANLHGEGAAIEFRSGCAFNEGPDVTSITQLIALADRRITGRTDTVAGLPNRNSCDEIINQYIDKTLPPTIGCIMLDIVNLKAINEKYSRMEGNLQLRQVSDILKEAARDLCFVGRNGGTCFLALFEECSEEKLSIFTDRVQQRIHEHNCRDNAVYVELTWGKAFSESTISNINQLIALANQRMHDNRF